MSQSNLLAGAIGVERYLGVRNTALHLFVLVVPQAYNYETRQMPEYLDVYCVDDGIVCPL